MNQFYHAIDRGLGLDVDAADLSTFQMCARGVIVFASSLAMFRLAHKRFFAQRNALDLLMALVIASVLARAINGDAALFPTIGVGFFLVMMHRMLGWLAGRSPFIGRCVKGHTSVLILNGDVDEAVMRRHHISREDLEQDLRINGVASAAEVRCATLERNGEVSVIRIQR